MTGHLLAENVIDFKTKATIKNQMYGCNKLVITDGMVLVILVIMTNNIELQQLLND